MYNRPFSPCPLNKKRYHKPMKKISLIALLAGVTLTLSACSVSNLVPDFLKGGLPKEELTIKTQSGSVVVKAEVADDDEERSQGLMNREKLESGNGMLFVFEDEAPRAFWMKNTLIPLDIIFIDETDLVTDIFTAQPQPNTPDSRLKIYQSSVPTKYVIEINANTSQQINLQIGDYIKLANRFDEN